MRRRHEQGEAQARSARPPMLVAADWEWRRWSRARTKAVAALNGGRGAARLSAADAQPVVLRRWHKEPAERASPGPARVG
jgi:hypothetical protein